MENILTWGEYVQVDRGTDEEDDLERAKTAAEDMDRIAVARDRKAGGARLRFDLDLPAASEDDLVLADGERLPEWDWKQRRLLPDHCRIQETAGRRGPALPAARASAPHRPAPARSVPGPGPGPHLAARPPGRAGHRPGRLSALRHRSPRRRPGRPRPPLSRHAQRRPRPGLPAAGGPVPLDRHLGRRPGPGHRRHPRQPLPLRREPGRHRRPLRHARLQLPPPRPGAGPPAQGPSTSPTAPRCAGASRPSSPAITPASGPASATPPSRLARAARRPPPAADPLRRQAQRPRPLRGPLRHRGHPPRRPARPAARAWSPSASPSIPRATTISPTSSAAAAMWSSAAPPSYPRACRCFTPG